MRLLLLGATGRVGQIVLKQALADGHHVVALIRTPSKITLQHPHLKVVQGDARSKETLAKLTAGQDAILSTLGHNSLKKSQIQTDATKAVLAAIKPHQRFITLTGTGIPDPADPPHGLGAHLMTLIIKLLPGGVYEDAMHHVVELQNSSANWVVVRAPVLTAGPRTHRYRTGHFRLALTSVATRADVADFMLANLRSDQWLGQLPLIVSPRKGPI